MEIRKIIMNSLILLLYWKWHYKLQGIWRNIELPDSYVCYKSWRGYTSPSGSSIIWLETPATCKENVVVKFPFHRWSPLSNSENELPNFCHSWPISFSYHMFLDDFFLKKLISYPLLSILDPISYTLTKSLA